MHKVGVLGSATVGQTLAQGFKRHGHQVMVGSRTPEKLAGFSSSSGIAAGSFADVARWCDLAVLAVRGAAAADACRLAGEANLHGKVVIDTTNPIGSEPPVDGVLQFFTGPNASLMEQLQSAFPQPTYQSTANRTDAVGHTPRTAYQASYHEMMTGNNGMIAGGI